MSVRGDMVAALMAHVESLSGFGLVWAKKGEGQPDGEHVRISLVPNDDIAADIDTQVKRRRGFIVLTLVAALTDDDYQVVIENKAGTIEEHFPRGLRLTSNGTTAKIVNSTTRTGRRESGRWETPVWIEYEAWA